MTIRKFVPLSVLCLALLMGAAALTVRAGQENANPAVLTISGGVAVVDMDKLYVASGAQDAARQKMIEISQDAEQRVGQIAAVPFLTPAERMELVDLISVFQPTAKQQDRAKELKALSDQRADEIQKITVKKQADVTPADRARLDELSGQRRALEQVLPGIQAGAHMEENEKLEAFRREQVAQIRAVVGQVAKERGITNVFDVNALVYSTTDLSSVVLQRLAKHK